MPVAFIDRRRSIRASHITFLNSKSNKVNKRPKSCYTPVSGNASTTDYDPYTSVRKIFYEFPKKNFYGDHNIDNQIFIEPIAARAYNESVTLDALTESAQPGNSGEKSWMIVKSRLVSLKRLSVPNYAALETPKCTDKNNNKNHSLDNLVDEDNGVESAGRTHSSCSNKKNSQTISNCACPLASNIHDKKALQNVALADCPMNQLSVSTQMSESRRVVNDAPTSAQRATCIAEKSHFVNRKADASAHDPSRMCADGIDLTLAEEKTRKLCQRRRNGTERPDWDDQVSDVQHFDRKNRCPERHEHVVERVATTSASASFAPRSSSAKEDSRDSNVKTCGCQQACASGENNSDLAARFLTGIDDDITSTSARSSNDATGGLLFIPWSKRATLTPYNPFARKQKTRLSSTRPTRSRTSSDSDAVGLPASSACLRPRPPVAGAGSLHPFSSNISNLKLRRHKSDSDTIRRPRTSSIAVAVRPSVIASGFIKGSTDAPKALLRCRTKKMQACFFFSSFFDKIRDETFAIDFPALPIGDLEILDEEIRKNVIAALCGRLLGSTYKRLFHIRCRLSEFGRQSEFSCDGIFGCDEHLETIQATQAHWV